MFVCVSSLAGLSLGRRCGVCVSLHWLASCWAVGVECVCVLGLSLGRKCGVCVCVCVCVCLHWLVRRHTNTIGYNLPSSSLFGQQNQHHLLGGDYRRECLCMSTDKVHTTTLNEDLQGRLYTFLRIFSMAPGRSS